MKPIHVASTIVRLFSICLAIYSFTLFLNAWIFFVNTDVPVISIISVSFPVSLVIISVLLWHFPISISRKITGLPPHSDNQELSFNGDEFLSICLFSLGVYFFYGLIGEGVYWSNYFSGLSFEDGHEALSLDVKSSLWSLGVRFVFTTLLLAGNKQVVTIYKRLRHGG